MTFRVNQSTRLRVASFMLPMMGHKTYGDLLRQQIEQSSRLEYLPHWTNEDPEFLTRVVNKMLRLRVPSRWLRELNADMYFARGTLGYALFARRILQRTIAGRPVDVLYFHTQTAALLATDFMKTIPAIVSLDQTAMQLGRERPKLEWSLIPDRVMERRVFNRAMAVVPWSRWAATSIIEGHGISPEKVHVIPPGVKLQHFADMHALRSRRVRNGTQKILFVGSDLERKGGRTLVDVFLNRFGGRDIQLHLVTNASGIPEHPQIIVHSNVQAYTDAWKDLYASADIFVLPAKNEAFGLAFVEAMAAGLPAIGTRINAIPEIIADGETGLLVRPDDARELGVRLEQLLGDAALRRRLGANGRTRVAALFDSAKNSAQLEDLFFRVSRRRRVSRS